MAVPPAQPAQLQDLRLIERRLPATVPQMQQHRSRMGRYHLSDPFLRFHFRFDVVDRKIVRELIAKAPPVRSSHAARSRGSCLRAALCTKTPTTVHSAMKLNFSF